MKYIPFYTLILIVVSSMLTNSFAQNQNDGKLLNGDVKVAVIESIPTRPEDQKSGQEYIYDYHVLRYLKVSKTESDEIRSLVNGGSLFDGQNAKSCLFEPGFAIVGEEKRKWFPLYLKTRGEVIISTGTCGKAILLSNGKESYKDLSQNNALEQILVNLK